MKVTRVAKICISKKHKDYPYFLNQMSYSKNIYNYINFLIRQLFFKKKNKDFVIKEDIFNEYPTLTSDLKDYFDGGSLLNSTILTRIAREFSRTQGMDINTKVVTSVVRKLISDWTGFFGLLKQKKAGVYKEKVSIPKYKKEKYNLVEYNIQTISKTGLKNNKVMTSSMEGVTLPSFVNPENVLSFRVYYKNSSVVSEIIYQKETGASVEDLSIKDKNARVCAADPGLDVLMALTFNFEKRPLNISGKNIKSINQYFNKEISAAKSVLPTGVYMSKNINNLYNKRESQIRNHLGFICNKLIDMLKENNVNVFIIGCNKEQKKNINIGKVNNQNFVQIPYYKLRQILKYKLEEAGIMYVEQEESYTSKASFLDGDKIPSFNKGNKKDHKFSGKRVKRGLYKSKDGKLIHADTNGSFNIMRKAGINIPKDLSLFEREIITPLRFA